MKAHSIDLRQKIIDVYKNEKISQRQLAKRFDVTLSFIVKLLKQYRQTGEIAPKAFRGGVQPKLTTEQTRILVDLIKENNDATLVELCHLLKEKTGIIISRATMGRMAQRLKLIVDKSSIATDKKIK